MTTLSIRAALVALCGIALLLGCGCRKSKSEPPVVSNSGEKRSGFSKFLAPEGPVGYPWDGQNSKGIINLGIEAAYDRTLEALRTLSFTINENDTKRQGATARIVALNSAKTVVQVELESKTDATTAVKAKVGATGDRGGSERILDEIQKGPRPAPVKKKQ